MGCCGSNNDDAESLSSRRKKDKTRTGYKMEEALDKLPSVGHDQKVVEE